MVNHHSAKYNAYSTASQTMPKTTQIVMLYDGAIRYMQQAKEAITAKQFEERYKLLVRASEVVLGLQSCLDFDASEEMARLLFDYYSAIDARIMTIHRSNSLEMCDRVVAELKEMRDAWQQIDRRPENYRPAATQPTVEDASGLHVSA